jgi:peptidyl-prolyl cis-trans isomerase SurA
MRFCKVALFSILIVILIGAAAQSEIADKIIAVVNDEIITQSDFNKGFEPYLKRIEETYKGNDKEMVITQTKAAFLQRMIDDLLIAQEAKKAGAGIREEEVRGVLQDMLAKQNTTLEDFLKKQEREGNSLESINEEIKRQLMRTRLMRQEIKSKIMVSDQEIGDYYNQNREKYEGKEAVRLKQILLLVPADANAAVKDKIKEEAQQIQKRALSGEQFEMLAQKYSQGPAADQGGDIGFIERGVTIPELEEAAFSLPMDRVSNLIESSVGFHIIKVVDKRGAGLKPIETVREEIKVTLENEKLEKKFDEWIAAIRKKSHIEIR